MGMLRERPADSAGLFASARHKPLAEGDGICYTPRVMYIAVIVGRVVAALFAFCGVVNILAYAGGVTKAMGYMNFIHGLAEAAWPLAVGITIWILVEAVLHLEKLVFHADSSAVPVTVPRKKPKPAKQPAGTPTYFNAPPVSQPEPAPAKADMRPATAPAPAPEPEKPAEKPIPKDDGMKYFKVD